MPSDPNLSTALENSDNGTLSNILRFLGRPGYAFRSLLSGRLDDAAENLAQMLMDLPTGGFIDRRLSLANIVSDGGDITDDKERPEFTDLIHRWGFDSPGSRGFGANLALDLIGGTLTDPLTLLTGPTRSIFGRTIAGLPRAKQGALLADALRQTPTGTKALAEALPDVLSTIKRPAQPLGALAPGKRANVGWEGLAAEKVAGRRLGNTQEFDDAVRDLGQHEDVFQNPAQMAEAAPAYRAAIAAKDAAWAKQIDDLDEGLNRLRDTGHLGAGRGLKWAGVELPSAWVNTGRFATLPGLAREGLLASDKTKPIADLMDIKAQETWDWLVGSFVDKNLSSSAPGAMQYRAREINANQIANDRRVERVNQEIFAGLDNDGAKTFGTTLARYEDDYNKALHVAKASHELSEAAIEQGLVPGPRPPLPDPDEAMARFSAEVAQIPGMRPDSAKRYVDEMDRVRRESIKAGLWRDLTKEVPKGMTKAEWEKIATAPFYLPHQVSATFSTLLGDSFKNKALMDEVRNIFMDRRGYRAAKDFSAALDGVALKHGIRTEGLTDLQDFDIRTLFDKRLKAHNRTMARHELMGTARSLGMVTGDPLSEYLKQQLAPVGRESIDFMPARKAAEFVGGGKFRVEVTGNPRLAAMFQNVDKNTWLPRTTRTEPNGRVYGEIAWPGVHTMWKSFLTSASGPAYHFRNNASAIVAGGFDEDIGYAAGGRALKGMFYSSLRSPLVKRYTDMGLAPNEIADAVNLLHHDPTVRGAALAKLEETGTKVGKHSWTEFSSIIDGAVPQWQNVADLDRAIGSLDAFGHEINYGWNEVLQGKAGNRLLAGIRKVVQFGADLANASEQHYRVGAMIDLLRKGVDPVEATRRMQKVYVNYNVNSQAERFARDAIPFLRFTLGSTQWVKTIASKPRLAAWMGRVKGSAENSSEDQGPLPSRASESLAIPLPWADAKGNAMFLTSLGLPQEVAMKVLGVGTPQGFRQQILGGLSPVIRFPLEAATGKSMFFNEEFGSYRKAPSWLPDALTQEITLPDGTKRREISGVINEVLGSLPTSRIEGFVDSALSENKPAWQTLVNFATGARVLSVDQEKELARRLAAFLKAEADKGTVGSTLAWFSRLSKEDMPPEVTAALKAVQQQKADRRRRHRSLVSAE